MFCFVFLNGALSEPSLALLAEGCVLALAIWAARASLAILFRMPSLATTSTHGCVSASQLAMAELLTLEAAQRVRHIGSHFENQV